MCINVSRKVWSACYALYGGFTISVHRVNSCRRILIGVREVQTMKSMGTFMCYHQYYGTICTDRYLDEFLCVLCNKGCP
jgi:hypothetical protein